MSAGDHFDYGDTIPTGAGARVVMWSALTLFVVAIFGTAVVDLVDPAAPTQLVGREAAEQERLDRDARLWDGTLAQRIEYHQRDRSLVRKTVVPWFGYRRLVYLDEAPRSILVGRDHWLFLRRRIDLERDRSVEYLANAAVPVVSALDRRLATRGAEFTFLPIPRKSYAAREMLPSGYDGRHAFDDLLFDVLERENIHTIDLRASFDREDPEEVYFKLDTHWTRDAAVRASEVAARTLGLWKPEGERAGTIELEELDLVYAGLQLLYTIGIDRKKVDLSMMDLRPPSEIWVKLPQETAQWARAGRPDSPLALAGTSFSHQGKMAQTLMHFTGERIFDGVMRGGGHMRTVQTVLGNYDRSDVLEHMIWETPAAMIAELHQKTGPYYADAVAGSFLAYRPGPLETLLDIPPRYWSPPRGKPLDLKRFSRKRLLALPHGILAHSGDGAMSLRLAGTLEGDEARLMLSVDGTIMDLWIPPGEFDFTVPLVAAGPASGTLVLMSGVRDRGVLTFEVGELVHEAVGDGRVLLEPVGGGEAWRPMETAVLGRRAALLARVTDDGALNRMTVRAIFRGDEAPVETTFRRVTKGGLLALDLGSREGAELARVEFVGVQGPVGVGGVRVTGLAD